MQVVVNGAGTPLGRAAIRAISAARGMEVAAAVDSSATLAGQDAGEVRYAPRYKKLNQALLLGVSEMEI